MNSKEKGGRGERLLAKELQKYGYDARRGQQFKGGADSPDVLGLPGVHIECKFYKDPLTWAQKEQFMQQAVRDSEGKNMPAVFHKANRKEWEVTLRSYPVRGESEMVLITMRLSDFMKFYGGWWNGLL